MGVKIKSIPAAVAETHPIVEEGRWPILWLSSFFSTVQ